MKEYDLIAFGTGSAMNIVEPFLRRNPRAKVAVIDKDEPGGICLTRGCIPTKILAYPAELVNLIGRAKEFGIEAKVTRVDFARVMRRMRGHVDPEVRRIRKGLREARGLDYYHAAASFIAPYTLEVGGERIHGKRFLLCTGSKVTVPPIEGLGSIAYHTSDTIMHITRRPASLLIAGGGYIACEFGHFFAAMGTKVTILGRNERLLPDEEPEISQYVRTKLAERVRVVTGHEVLAARPGLRGAKVLTATDRRSGKVRRFAAEMVLVATGRSPLSDVLHPEKAGIKTDAEGWIIVNDHLETSQPDVWAFGDATGRYPFKHKANYESVLVGRALLFGVREPATYHAVPHAVFTDPEVGAVGLREEEAVREHGAANVRIGFASYGDVAKGFAIGVEDGFVKAIVHADGRILGAHVVGPYASILVQEIVNLMNTPDRAYGPLVESMHIHPALSEVVERAFQNVVPVAQYHESRR